MARTKTSTTIAFYNMHIVVPDGEVLRNDADLEGLLLAAQVATGQATDRLAVRVYRSSSRRQTATLLAENAEGELLDAQGTEVPEDGRDAASSLRVYAALIRPLPGTREEFAFIFKLLAPDAPDPALTDLRDGSVQTVSADEHQNHSFTCHAYVKIASKYSAHVVLEDGTPVLASYVRKWFASATKDHRRLNGDGRNKASFHLQPARSQSFQAMKDDGKAPRVSAATLTKESGYSTGLDIVAPAPVQPTEPPHGVTKVVVSERISFAPDLTEAELVTLFTEVKRKAKATRASLTLEVTADKKVRRVGVAEDDDLTSVAITPWEDLNDLSPDLGQDDTDVHEQVLAAMRSFCERCAT